jgi:hypothetical protein
MSMQFLMDFAATDERFRTIVRRAAEYRAVHGVALDYDPYWLYCWRLAQEIGESALMAFPFWIFPGPPWMSDAHLRRRLIAEHLGIFPRPILDEEILKWRPHGWKERAGMLSLSEAALPIVVKVCVRPAQSSNDRIPSVEDLREGVDGFRVIVQTEPQSSLCANPRKKRRPVVGGISMGVGTSDFATLGIILENDAGDRFALTCAHAAAQGSAVLQPSQRDSKKASVIGHSVLATPLTSCTASDPCNDESSFNELDLSLIQIDSTIPSNKEVLDIGPLNGVVRHRVMSGGQTVEVMGRSSRYHALQLGDLHVWRSLEHNGQFYCYKNLFRVESPYGATDIIRGGDSGAPVCIASGTGKGLCGIIVASNAHGGFAMFGDSIEAWWKKHGYSLHV